MSCKFINVNALMGAVQPVHSQKHYVVNVELKLIIYSDYIDDIEVYCVFAASCSQLKTEADNRDITGHPRDDKTRSDLCTVCHKHFTTKSQLTNHSKIHTKQNEYSCTQCEKRFASRSGLCNHMNIHTVKYKCTECGKCYQSRQHLVVHRRSHSGEKPFECTVCSKRFTTSSELVVHSSFHSGER